MPKLHAVFTTRLGQIYIEEEKDVASTEKFLFDNMQLLDSEKALGLFTIFKTGVIIPSPKQSLDSVQILTPQQVQENLIGPEDAND